VIAEKLKRLKGSRQKARKGRQKGR